MHVNFYSIVQIVKDDVPFQNLTSENNFLIVIVIASVVITSSWAVRLNIHLIFPIWSGETTFVNFHFCQSLISDSDVIVHNFVIIFYVTMIVLNSKLYLFCDQ